MIENLDLSQIIFVLFTMAFSAIVVGFMAGFFGIGGGLIMGPILFYIFSFVGIEKTFKDMQRRYDRQSHLSESLFFS